MAKIFIECENDKIAAAYLKILCRGFYVAKKIKKSPCSISGDNQALYEIEVTPRVFKKRKTKLNSEQKEEIIQKSSQGKTLSELANEYQVSRSTVYNVVKNLNNPYLESIIKKNIFEEIGYELIE